MLFNSARFVVFFLAVYALYLLGRRHHRFQNRMLLAASYVFYGAWDWRFLGLLLISTLVDYVVGLRMGATDSPSRRKGLLVFSIVAQLGMLGFFKYFGFFLENLTSLLEALGLRPSPWTLRLILPVGISFYTFQTLSYTFDIYRRRMQPTRDFLDFALFVAFFPQLVAGPIERAANLLPQIARPRILDAARIDDGLFLILWGYFKKVVIADQAAQVANLVFKDPAAFTGGEILLGILAFTIQIYGDFSGYSDIARGTAKLMGFELMVNFRLPYFAISPSDFWQRWHISLSSWLRDYLFFPLGGPYGSRPRQVFTVMVTFLLSGLWHGAAWNFVIWGAYHGAIIVAYDLAGWRKAPAHKAAGGGSTPAYLARMGLMFVLTLIGWVIFRAESPAQIGTILTRVGLDVSAAGLPLARTVLLAALPLVVVQILQHRRRDLLAPARLPGWQRIPLYTLLLAGLAVLGVRQSVDFIYFQF